MYFSGISAPGPLGLSFLELGDVPVVDFLLRPLGGIFCMVDDPEADWWSSDPELPIWAGIC
jgi:hypothetical protein